MPKEDGWVKIHRKILATDLTASEFKFFVGAIILSKSPKSKEPGMVDLSVRKLATDLHMSRSEVQRREKDLESKGMLTILNKGFIINNYNYYQTVKSVSPAGQKVPLTEHLRDTGTTCWVCGKHEMLPSMKDYADWLAARFQEHHIIPLSKGGTEEPDNKVQLCQFCHKQSHHNQLDVKRTLSVESQKKLEFLQSKTVPREGQLLDKTDPPTGLNDPPTGLNDPPAGLNVPSRIAVSANKKSKTIKTIKNTFGEFKNVLLTEKEHKQLTDKFGKKEADSWIETLSGGMASNPKKYNYTSHYAAILNWQRRDKDNGAKRGSTGIPERQDYTKQPHDSRLD